MKHAMVFVFIMVFLFGCGHSGPQGEFEGLILKVKDSSIVCSPTDEIDPEASYPTFEFIVNKETQITGQVDEFSELKEGQWVDIWVEGDGEEIQAMQDVSDDQNIATKIIVEEN